jgi:hypothetical protein
VKTRTVNIWCKNSVLKKELHLLSITLLQSFKSCSRAPENILGDAETCSSYVKLHLYISKVYLLVLTLGSTHFLTQMSTRDVVCGKDGWCVSLTTLPPSCADCLEILSGSTLWSVKGLSRPEQEYLCLLGVPVMNEPFVNHSPHKFSSPVLC